MWITRKAMVDLNSLEDWKANESVILAWLTTK